MKKNNAENSKGDKKKVKIFLAIGLFIYLFSQLFAKGYWELVVGLASVPFFIAGIVVVF